MKKTWHRQHLIDTLYQHENKEIAGPMVAYMKNHFPFIGIKSPQRKELLKQYLTTYELPAYEEIQAEVEALFKMPEREFQYVAIELLNKVKKQLTIDDLPFCQKLIEQKSWWDSVDGIAPIVGEIVKKHRVDGENVMKEWNKSENMWVVRASIIHQLKFKKDTNESLLYDFILPHNKSTEFFIQKAIGWALREYAKTNPESVITFVENHELKPLSKREALKNIKGVK